ncbi:MAG: M48 family metalloprotease, partial [Bdellovibrionales bacterium]|nr:M48 family metalloprotease [Bdellovibrionales bacterium]
AIPDDAELSSILAHEIGHVLAGHTQPDPVEEAQQMLASITGDTASRMMTIYGNNTISALAGLGGLIASELMEALIVNPNKQANELEADQLGLFVMAEAGFDPRKAISFWTRAQHDPNFQSTPIEFLSTHPSSETRLERLLQILPQAMTRYEQRGSGDGNGNEKASVLSEHAMEQSVAARDHATLPPSESSKRWIAAEQGISVFGQADKSAAQIGTLDKGQHVTVKHRLRRWLFITAPYEGYVESHRFYPEN